MEGRGVALSGLAPLIFCEHRVSFRVARQASELNCLTLNLPPSSAQLLSKMGLTGLPLSAEFLPPSHVGTG